MLIVGVFLPPEFGGVVFICLFLWLDEKVVKKGDGWRTRCLSAVFFCPEDTAGVHASPKV